jgi:hypothetical protein
MSEKQIANVCRHFGLSEWQPAFSRLILDYVISDREFGRLLRRKRRFRDCLDMMKCVLSEPYIRLFFGDNEELEFALSIAAGKPCRVSKSRPCKA